MTPEQHNKFVGIGHVVHAGLGILMTGAMMIFMIAMIKADSRGAPPPTEIFVFLGFFVTVLTIFFYAPSLVAGYALLKRKKWAKTAGIIAGVMSSMSAPVGTAICAYTFWFLFSEPGKTLYDKPQQTLPPMPPTWYQQTTQTREPVYTPSSTPPDWR